MQFESFTPEKKLLYRERPSASLDEKLETLTRLESGKIEKIKLSEVENKEFLKYEDSLGEKLEKIYSITPINTTFCIEYFLTPEGRAAFKENTGQELRGNDIAEISDFIIRSRDVIRTIKPEKRAELAGKTREYMEEQLLKVFMGKIGNDGELNIDGIPNPTKISLSLKPEKALEKISKLREFKSQLKNELLSIEKFATPSSLLIAKNKILQLYLKKVNAMISSNFSTALLAKQLEARLGKDSLDEAERGLLDTFKGLSSAELNLSRTDRFLHGAEKEYDETGNRVQVSQEILKFVDKIEALYIKNELEKNKHIEEMGLDPEKIFRENISAEKFSTFGEEFLEHLGIKSSQSASKYNPDRKGPADDNKWQFIPSSAHKSMSLNSKQKIIKSGIESKSIYEVIAIQLGHETTHLLQALNRETIPLRLFKKVGTDRTSLFNEGGAMLVQDEITKKAFGFNTIPHPHYIRAMIKKLEGGSYLDCIQAFYNSSLKKLTKKRKLGSLDEIQFEAAIKNELKLAINRSRRLFEPGESLAGNKKMLTYSADTAYLEQAILLDKLKDNGMEKLTFCGSGNIDTLITLSELNLIDLKNIRKPDYHALEVWDKLKYSYKL